MTKWQSSDERVLGRLDAATVARFDQVLALAINVRTNLGVRLGAMRDADGAWPKAASYDTPTASTPLWCRIHQRSHAACVARGALCRGEPIVTAAADPTGERAVSRDPAVADRREVDRYIRALTAALFGLMQVLDRYVAREASALERARVANEPGCSSCGRRGRWESVAHPRTTANGNLARPMALCWWCYRWTLDTGRLPSVAELTQHHEGRAVRRSVQPERRR